MLGALLGYGLAAVLGAAAFFLLQRVRNLPRRESELTQGEKALEAAQADFAAYRQQQLDAIKQGEQQLQQKQVAWQQQLATDRAVVAAQLKLVQEDLRLPHEEYQQGLAAQASELREREQELLDRRTRFDEEVAAAVQAAQLAQVQSVEETAMGD